jgi:hypothetical protein
VCQLTDLITLLTTEASKKPQKEFEMGRHGPDKSRRSTS